MTLRTVADWVVALALFAFLAAFLACFLLPAMVAVAVAEAFAGRRKP